MFCHYNMHMYEFHMFLWYCIVHIYIYIFIHIQNFLSRSPGNPCLREDAGYGGGNPPGSPGKKKYSPYTHVYTYIHMYIYTYIHIFTIYIYTYIYVYICNMFLKYYWHVMIRIVTMQHLYIMDSSTIHDWSWLFSTTA